VLKSWKNNRWLRQQQNTSEFRLGRHRIKTLGIDMVRLNFTDENPKEVKDIVKMHRDLLNNGSGALDSYKQLIDKIKAEALQKGISQGCPVKWEAFR